MSDLSRIYPKLFLSSFRPAGNLALLKRSGIVAVVNVSNSFEDRFAASLTYLDINVDDEEETELLPFFEESNEFIHTHSSGSDAVLVHCAAGVSRSATMVVAYLMRHKALRLKDALIRVLSRRSCIRPNFGFLHQLMEYEHRLVSEGILKTRRSEETYPFFGSKDILEFLVLSRLWILHGAPLRFEEAKRLSLQIGEHVASHEVRHYRRWLATEHPEIEIPIEE